MQASSVRLLPVFNAMDFFSSIPGLAYTGKKDLVEVTNYWQMVMDLCPYLFRVCLFFSFLVIKPAIVILYQCGAVIFQ